MMPKENLKIVGLAFDITKKYVIQCINFIEKQQGYKLILIANKSNRDKLSYELNRSVEEIDKAAIWLTNINDPLESFKEIQQQLNIKEIKLDNWVNPFDKTTDTFLYTVEKLDAQNEFTFFSSYRNCRIKPIARQLTEKNGLTSDKYQIIDISESANSRINLDFPFICKPITGSGSYGVKKINELSDLDCYIKSHLQQFSPNMKSSYTISGYNPQRQILLETFLEGNECEIDGYVDEGNIYICSLGFKFCENTKNGYRELGGIFYRPYTFVDYEKRDDILWNWAKRLLEDLQFNSGVFHIEAFWNGSNGKNKVNLIEVNPRPVGGGGIELIEELSGVNLLEECINLWLGKKASNKPSEEKGAIFYTHLYPDRNGTYINIKKPYQESQNKNNLIDIKVQINERTFLGNWEFFVKEGDKTQIEKEQYIGIFKINNIACFSREEDMFKTIKSINKQLLQQNLFEIT